MQIDSEPARTSRLFFRFSMYVRRKVEGRTRSMIYGVALTVCIEPFGPIPPAPLPDVPSALMRA